MKYLERMRLAKGLTQEELGKRAKCSAQAISNYERGLRRPVPRVYPLLAAAFDIDPMELTRLIHPDSSAHPGQ